MGRPPGRRGTAEHLQGAWGAVRLSPLGAEGTPRIQQQEEIAR